jgi:hypothetical protein
MELTLKLGFELRVLHLLGRHSLVLEPLCQPREVVLLFSHLPMSALGFMLAREMHHDLNHPLVFILTHDCLDENFAKY